MDGYPNETLSWRCVRIPVGVENPSNSANDEGNQEKNTDHRRYVSICTLICVIWKQESIMLP